MDKIVNVNTETIITADFKAGLTVYIDIVKPTSSGGSTTQAPDKMTWDSTNKYYYYAYTFTATGDYRININAPATRQKVVLGYQVVGAVTTVTSGAAVYCEATDVSRVLGIVEDGSRLIFSESTLPTVAEVDSMIEEASDEIDKNTGHAWRTVTISNELYDYSPPQYGDWPYYRRSDNSMIHLKHRKIRNFTSGTHKIEIWDGSSWGDLISGSFTEGRGSDYWIDYERGIVFFIGKRPRRKNNAVRMTYAFGNSVVPKDIRKLCATIVALELLDTSFYSSIVPEDSAPHHSGLRDRWVKLIDKITREHTEISVF